MDKNELIDRLCEDLEPTRARLSLPLRIVCWVATVFIITALGILKAQSRADFSDLLNNTEYLIEGTLLLVAGISSGILVLFLSVPGWRTKKLVLTVIITGLIWISSIAATLIFQGSDVQGLSTAGLGCSEHILLFSLIPAVILTALLRLGSPLRAHITGALIFLSSGILTILLFQFTCASRHPAHLLLYHTLPVGLLTLIGWILGKWLCGFESKLERKKKALLP
ncbi:MAG: DUF1109 family protein [Bdellovibrionales bacterium]|nr:DUF1109 family protein [Bdellovibrionales bacterium]